MISLLVKTGSEDKDKLLNEIESTPEYDYDWRLPYF